MIAEPQIFTVLRSGEPIAIVRASGAAEACAMAESAIAMDDARAILERAGLSGDAVIGALVSEGPWNSSKLQARGPTIDERDLWIERAASGSDDGAALAIMML